MNLKEAQKDVLPSMIRTFEPIAALRKLVDYIWIVDFDFLAADRREDIIMPLGHMNMIFNYGAAYKLVEEDRETVISDSVMIGQIKSAKRVRYGSHLHQIGVAFTPLGFNRLFDVPGIRLTEQIVDTVEVDPGLNDMHRTMTKIKDVEQKLAVINQYIQHRLATSEKDTGRIEQLLAYVEREYEHLNIAAMAGSFGVSVSTLERFFKKHVGLTPKTYGDIIKFRIHTEDKELRRDIQHYYYDQSHLIKTSRKLAGKTIRELEEPSNEITLDYVWHGQEHERLQRC